VEVILGVIMLGVIAVLFMVVMAFVSFFGAIPTYFLWNWLMPDLFGLPVLGFWQAWGIFLLLSILFKGASVSSK
jgi:hypothetical protein